MTPMTRIDKDAALEDVAAIAQDYFAARDDLDSIKTALLEAILVANEGGGATQQEIADRCDLRRDSGNDEHQFHRTRIQQFLREARRRA